MEDINDAGNPYAPPRSLESSASGPPFENLEHLPAPRIHGWLLLPAIGLVVGPLAMLGSIFSDLVAVRQQQSRGGVVGYSGSAAAFWGTTVLDLLFVVLTVYVARQFFNKKRTTPRWMIRLYSVALSLAMIECAWYASLNPVFLPEGITAVVNAALGAAIWIPYFSFSKRVKCTFVR